MKEKIKAKLLLLQISVWFVVEYLKCLFGYIVASENLIIFFSISRSSGVHGSMHDKTEYSKLSAKKCLMSELITKK